MKSVRCWTNAVALAAALSFCSVAALAQDDGPTKRQGVEYLRIVYLDYKADKRNEARGIIDDYFAPASQKAGTPAPKMIIHFQTGEWDTISVWALEAGMGQLEWTQITPNWLKWKAALDEMAGGEEEGTAIMRRYNEAIARRRVEVGHHHLAGMD